MKIGIIGASGKAGDFIMKEALSRGNEVTAIVRTASKISEENVTILEKDLYNLTAADLAGFDVVVDAFNAAPGKEEMHKTSIEHLLTLLKGNDHTRLVVVGGAGSLFVDEAETARVMETPDFPAAFLPTAKNMGAALDLLEGTKDVLWTYLSPAAMFVADGARTGSYTLGGNLLQVNSQGESTISYADYAIAMLDEIEQGKHFHERISVVSK
ncbi:NAD(P)-dependent oxidoreductase [Isobaculum melis]|uniref:NAD(P)-binding domain-containing protein n=1 Tax=Isobaculum melis TaxID=142588 RepID=A0A1H9UIX5_9LACT|nr:NAD(P)-dependent oxidoreductase [Isobaculum melis]SES08993.1 hypothetical protein SAMN04488559_13115 [Isobaculum melis]